MYDLKYYVLTTDIGKNSLYSVIELVNGNEFNNFQGIVNGNGKSAVYNTVDYILKKLEHTTSLDIKKSIYFKFENCEYARYMGNKFDNDDNMLEKRRKNGLYLFSSPSIFLSDCLLNTKNKKLLDSYVMYQTHFNKRLGKE